MTDAPASRSPDAPLGTGWAGGGDDPSGGAIPRVLHFSPAPEVLGGANRSMLTLVGELAKRGPAWVFGVCDGVALEAARSVGAEGVYACKRWPRVRLMRAPLGVLGLVRAIRRHQIELMHAHTAIANHYCAAAKRITGVPLVTHCRDNYQPNYYHQRLAAADFLISISEAVTATLPAELTGPERLATIHNPVRPPAEPPAMPGGERLRVAMAGRCTPDKGQDVFLDALLPLTLAPDSRPERDAVGPVPRDVGPIDLSIWGLDESEFGQSLRRRVAEFAAGQCGGVDVRASSSGASISGGSLSGCVVLEGFRNDIEHFYAWADVVAVPSRFAEPLGRMAMESMAYGRATVVAAHGGLVEVTRDDVDALWHRPIDAMSLREQVARLLRDEALRERLATAGRRRAMEAFAPGPYCERVLSVYRRVLGRGTN